MAKRQTKVGPVVATLNLKGGVGKTTASAHVFRMVWEIFRTPTLLIDFDPQFNLSQTLLTRDEYEEELKAERTIMAVMEPPPTTSLFKVNTSDAPPPDPADVSTPLWQFEGTKHINLCVLPGDFRLIKYSLVDDRKQLDAVARRFLAFVGKCSEGGRVTVLDCNPSSSFLTLCALRACTHVLVPVRPDRYSVLGVELLDQFLYTLPIIEPKPKKLILLNDVPRKLYDRSVEVELKSHPDLGPRTLTNRLYHSARLMAKPVYTGFATDKPGPYKKTLEKEIGLVAEEIGTELGLAP